MKSKEKKVKTSSDRDQQEIFFLKSKLRKLLAPLVNLLPHTSKEKEKKVGYNRKREEIMLPLEISKESMAGESPEGN